jgi:hypothetical protein
MRNLYIRLLKSCALFGTFAGHALQSAADAWSSLGERAQSAPAGVLGMVGGTLSTLPRILLGDVIGAYQAALEALVRTEAAGVCL